MSKNITTRNWVADEVPDARGFRTIRVSDGTSTGDLYEEPIATVYLVEHAGTIAASPKMLDALERGLEIANFVYYLSDADCRRALNQIYSINSSAIAKAKEV